MKNSVLAAVAWPYANGPRHIGHVSGFGVPADIFSRYMRMAGNDVLMVSGTDEHGTAIQVQADKEGLTPREVADKYHGVILEDLRQLGMSYDLYTRTTTRNHHQTVQQVFEALHRNGYVVSKTSKGAIAPSTGRALADRYIEGTCPLCGFESARGDQCDNCGNQLDPIDLINPRSRMTGETPIFVDSEHFFLDLPGFTRSLTEWLQERQDWRPNVLKFSQNFIDDLKPRAITRDLDWGVVVPLDGWRDLAMKRIYVWFDAVIGYLSASIEWAKRVGDPDAWKRFWQNPDALSYYFMGKDNIVFHSVIWPSILLGHNGAGDRGGEGGPFGKLNLPSEVVSSEFLNYSGSQFSTSRGNVLYVKDFLAEFGPDALRYYVSVAGPESHDVSFTWPEFVRRINFELANEWGNLVNRSISMAHKNVGAIPAPGTRQAVDEQLLATSRASFDAVGDLLSKNKIRAAMGEAMRLVSSANKYLSDCEPWKLKDDPSRRDTVLHTTLQVVSDCNTLMTPFLPHSSQKVFEALGNSGVWAAQPVKLEVDEPAAAPYPVLMGDYAAEQARWASVPVVPGTPLDKPSPIFAKLEDTLAENGPSWAPLNPDVGE